MEWFLWRQLRLDHLCPRSSDSWCRQEQERHDAGADILNVSGGANTAKIVRKIREKFPLIPIIATGGPTDESILETIEAGANAITYTPPTNGQLFKHKMKEYREIENKKYNKEF